MAAAVAAAAAIAWQLFAIEHGIIVEPADWLCVIRVRCEGDRFRNVDGPQTFVYVISAIKSQNVINVICAPRAQK